MTKKILLGVLMAIVVAAGFARPTVSLALTSDEIKIQVQSLMSQIASLTSQLNALRTQTPTVVATDPSVPSTWRVCALLNRNISIGMRGDDVMGMQEFLQSQGYFSGNVSGYFGPVTASAVAQWQVSQGVSGVGAVGPATRESVRIWCGNPAPTPICKPLTYMPIACSDGSQSQATHNEQGCITGYQCPVVNFVPPASCKSWNDGCNICSRTSPGSQPMCTMRACLVDSTTNSIWAGRGYCTAYFDTTTSNLPPVISGISGPTTLAVNTTGTWTVNASDPENGQLNYSIVWGDENRIYTPMMSSGASFDAYVQTSTFTHSYATAGTYTITVTVRDNTGQMAKLSITVQVGQSIVCTTEYQPVCGQPPEPACRHTVPACMIATQGPHTYGNQCELNAAGASFLYNGACNSGY